MAGVLCTVPKVAEMFHLNERTVRKWIATGRLTAWKVDGRPRVVHSDHVTELMALRDPISGRLGRMPKFR